VESDNIKNEINLKELFNTLLKYKWSILLITLTFTLLTYIYLYFKPSIYRSSSLIEVKSNVQKQVEEGAFLDDRSSSTKGEEKIDKEIELLQTFYINNKVLNKVNLQTQYFIDYKHKKVEIYENIPIKIKNITIFGQDAIGKIITIVPVKNGFYLKVSKSIFQKYINKIRSLFISNDKKLFTLNEKKLYKYNMPIETKYFELTIQRLHKFENPIYFILHGNNRQVFDIFKKSLIISQVSQEAPLIKVEFEDTVPKRADEYTNNLINIFVEQSIEDKSKKFSQLIDFINKQLIQIKKELNTYETKLEDYQKEHQAIQPSLQGGRFISEISKIENEISEYKLKEKLISNILLLTKSSNNIDTISSSLAKLEDRPTLALINKLQEVQIKEEELRAKYSSLHPSLRPIRKQIHHIQKSIMQNVKNLKLRITQKINSLNKLKKSYNKKLNQLPTKERKLIGLKRDYEVTSRIYDLLLKKKSETEIAKVATQSNYRVIDHAHNMGIPVRPKRLLVFIIGVLLGLIFGILQALTRNILDDKINSKKELEELTNLPLYGILPNIKKKNIKIEVLADPKSPYAEAHRSLRTNLQFTQNTNKAHVILITSTIMGEGKSTTVANLSAIFNLAGYKCVVINLDLRKPTLHKFFNVDNSIGMSTYLSGRSKIEDIIVPTDYEGLDVITSGPIPPNPSELIMTDKMQELIDELKEEYDYIFIDSAPLGLVTDTMNLMPYADINLIIFRENYALKSFAKDLNSLVERHDLKHIGLVLNGSDMSSGSYGYGYGY